MPTNAPAYMRDYMRSYRASGRDTSTLYRSKVLGREFIGVDGEGGNTESGYHAYFLLSAGDRKLIPDPGDARLTTRQCLQFLSDLSPDAIYVAYFFDYDVTKICEDLPWTKLDRLVNRSKRLRIDGFGTFPVDYEEFQLDYLPRKEFKVRRRIDVPNRCSFCDDGREYDDLTCPHEKPPPQYTPWIVVNDVGSFFQCRFVEALDKWSIGSEHDRELIGSGKEARGSFTIDQLDDISEYNQMEIVLLQELMGKFRDACQDVGYVPSKWQGPGLLAEAMFRAHGVHKTRDIALFNDPTYTDLIRYAANSFYGGRPEISVVGPVNAPVDQWDLNSAYPSSMRYVPCLMHGKWTYETNVDPYSFDRPSGKVGERYAILYGTFKCRVRHMASPRHRKRPMFYGLPIRAENGTILYPGDGVGWYWSFEVGASIHQSFDVQGAWVYQRTCECAPLSFVTGVYSQRLAVGKDSVGIVLKLGLNSLYGKTVQSRGRPKYSNPIWGSFITAMCRTQVQDFIHSSPLCTAERDWCGNDIIMIATDAVFTLTNRTDIVDDKTLGGWGREHHPRGMFLIQPGLYFGSSGKRAKTRGVPLSSIVAAEQQFRDNFDRLVSTGNLAAGDVVVPQQTFCGIRYTLHRRNLKFLGQWIRYDEEGKGGKVIRFDWSSKRAPYPALAPIPGVHDYIQTFPQDGDINTETVPYSKDIGGLQVREAMRLAFADNPDWAQDLEAAESFE